MFDEETAELYDEGVNAGYHNQQKYLRWLTKNMPTGSTILEIGCGTGSILIPLLSAGIRCEGLDSSSPMLNKLKQKNPEATVYESDVRTFQPSKTYDYILSCDGIFSVKEDELESYLMKEEDVLDVLNRYLNHTRQGILINRNQDKDGLVFKLSNDRESKHREFRENDYIFRIHTLFQHGEYVANKVNVKKRYNLDRFRQDFKISDFGEFISVR